MLPWNPNEPVNPADPEDPEDPEDPKDPVTAKALVLSSNAATLALGESQALSATVRWSDDREEDATAQVVWSSSAPEIVSVEGGTVRALLRGEAVITATFEQLFATAQISVSCNYPEDAGTQIRFNATMPKLSWPAAFDKTGMPYAFSLEDVYCSAEQSEVSTLIFVISAGWCPNCPDYMRGIAADISDIETAGARVVLVEAQDTSYNPADSADAKSWLQRIAGNNIAISAGDSDVLPNPGVFYDSPLITAFPTAFVVRTRDMKVIADQGRTNSILPFVQIALHPDADWSDPDNVMIQNCGPEEEETFEPNDVVSAAAELTAGTFAGGICTNAPDYYRVSLPGRFRFSLELRHAIGDLDVYVWNASANAAVTENGRKVGSYGATDLETFEYSGPALIRVEGYQGATAPYTLSLEDLQ
jgi:hypothetical protein